MIKRKKVIKLLIWTTTLAFVLMNVVAIFHSYKFTHFSVANIEKTLKPENLTFDKKLKAMLFGVNNPKPTNKKKPLEYESIELQNSPKIEGWIIRKDHYREVNSSKRGAMILFHGYGGEKSSMLDKANVFDSLKFTTLLVDFTGSGGSEGNSTTIGFSEAEQVKIAYDYLISSGETEIYLLGTSMGAVAIMKAVVDYDLNPRGIILECPFGTMYETVSARFRNMNVPTFPMAGLLVFWGGVQNGFWAFNHNPESYAKKVNCPTLLLYGELDKNVSRKEIDNIYKNLAGKKILKTYQFAGHENYLHKYKNQWTEDIEVFLKENE